MNKFCFSIALSFLLGLPIVVSSSPILQIDTSGQLTGARGISVLGNLFDVEFVDGSCVNIMGGCDGPEDFFFSTFAEAEAASLALLNTVFLNSGLGAFDTNPALTSGCDSSSLCQTITYYGDNTANAGAFAVIARNWVDESNDGLYSSNALSKTIDRADLTLAIWSAASPIETPEPMSIVLLSLSLLGLGFNRRKLLNSH